jgi:GDP-mannose 6-dehydrogenase
VRINIYGLGYVGSVSAACLAADGHRVLGIDIDRDKVDNINNGLAPVVEPGLTELIERGCASGLLRATAAAPEEADLSIVCVGTPSDGNGSLGLDYVVRAMGQIGDFLRRTSAYHTVSIRSTVLPGTVQTKLIPILERESGKQAGPDFGVCMNPEFLREGTSIRDYYGPPFTVIGQLDPHSGDAVEAIVANIPAKVLRTDLAVAEMVKYTGNAFHALKITFANEIGNL